MRNIGEEKVTITIRDSNWNTVFERKELPLKKAIGELQRYDAKKGNGNAGNGKKRNSNGQRKKKEIFKATSFDVSINDAVSGVDDGSEEGPVTENLEDEFVLSPNAGRLF